MNNAIDLWILSGLEGEVVDEVGRVIVDADILPHRHRHRLLRFLEGFPLSSPTHFFTCFYTGHLIT